MQIHELNTYAETPDDSTYLALDNGSETSKVPATDIYPAMTQSQITSGVNTVKRVLTAAVLKPAIIAVAKTITDKWVDMTTPNVNLDTSAASGDDYNLTQALTSLGWLSDVVTSGVLEGKKLLHKMLGFLSTETYPLTYTGVKISIAKKSGIVSIDIDGISSLASGNTVLGALPDGWKPKFAAYQVVGEPTGALNLRISVSAGGIINLYNYGQTITSTKNYALHLVYPTA